MLKALAWKEWREQRPLVLTAMAIAALLPLFFITGLAATSSSYQFEYLIALLTPELESLTRQGKGKAASLMEGGRRATLPSVFPRLCPVIRQHRATPAGSLLMTQAAS